MANGLSRAAVGLQNGFRLRKAVKVMVLSIRSSAFAYSPMFRRAPRGAAGGIRAAVLRAMAGFAALVALLLFAIPAQSDEIEPEPEPALQAEPEPEPALQAEPEPESVRDVVSDEEESSEPAWIPSLDFGFEGFRYDVDTTILNLDNPDLDDPKSWSDAQGGSVHQLVIRIGGELMGPMFEDLPGRPRLFVQGGAGFSMFSGEDVFEVGKPDVAYQPEDGIAKYYEVGAGDNDYPFEFKGQGSWFNANFQDPSWYAGLGIAFSLPTSGELLYYIKPSVQYSVQEIDFTGRWTAVEETSPPGTVDPVPYCGTRPNLPPCVRTFEIHESDAKLSTTDHSVGPGLEVAVGFLSTRPIRISLFGQVRALWLVSGTTNSYTDGVASYRIERDGFVFKGGAGIRLSWVGFD
jgi:hypothetical protein